MALLDQLWILDSEVGFWTDAASLRERIKQHFIRNDDWSPEDLFEELGAFKAGDARFGKFLEGPGIGRLHPRRACTATRRRGRQPRTCARSGPHCARLGRNRGYPIFSVVSTRPGRSGRPKNLIFATLGKPDIRFSDAIDNNIEIVGDVDKVLVYDQPIGANGIRWCDLQAWWKDTRGIADGEEAKKSLYQRLIKSLPSNSPSQRNLFDLYHEIHGSAVPDTSRRCCLRSGCIGTTRQSRSAARTPSGDSRMDFLLLLPMATGLSWKSTEPATTQTPDGRPDAATYANGAREDRELKLRGYEVFRFGAAELQDRERACVRLQEFFTELFRLFDISPGVG